MTCTNRSEASQDSSHARNAGQGRAANHAVSTWANWRTKGKMAASARQARAPNKNAEAVRRASRPARSEEHTTELQSLMRTSYAVICLKKKTNQTHNEKHRR